jgi:DinB superfamily
MTVAWAPLIVSQLEFYWDVHLRPRLDGLTDEEYLWEPVAGCWSLRPDERGGYTLDDAWPPPEPSPVTTIAWRMMHIANDCFAHPIAVKVLPDLAHDAPLPGTAHDAIAVLEDRYRRWHGVIASFTEDDVATPLGEAGGDFGAEPMGGLILHINREVMHHGGEIGVLRDLYGASFTS